MQAELENLAWKHNAPLTAFLELTHNCNFGCGHCYNFDRSKSQPKAHRPPLRLSDFKVILEQLKDLGVMQVCLTGGEPLVYRDLLPLCQFGSNLGLFLSLKTNGSRLSFEKLQELVAVGVKGIDITLYGLSELTQDSFVGVKDAWSNVTQAIKDIQKLPFELTINWSILRHNEHEETMLSARSEEFGQRINPIRGCKPRHDGSEDSTSHRAESNLEQLTKAEEAYRLKLLEESPHDHQFQCACAKTSLAISHTGIVWPCTSVPWEAGDILNTSLREIWESSPVLEEIRNLTLKDYDVCKKCPLVTACSRRNGAAYVESGSYTGAYKYAGELTWAWAKHHGYAKPPCLTDSES